MKFDKWNKFEVIKNTCSKIKKLLETTHLSWFYDVDLESWNVLLLIT